MNKPNIYKVRILTFTVLSTPTTIIMVTLDRKQEKEEALESLHFPKCLF